MQSKKWVGAAASALLLAAASVPTKFIEQHLAENVPVVRAMPNTPCAIGCGMTGVAGGKHAAASHLELARARFGAVGRAVVLDEKHMDAVTGLSASGPAYIYIILESLAEAGVKVGLPRDIATLLAAQTTLGAGDVGGSGARDLYGSRGADRRVCAVERVSR